MKQWLKRARGAVGMGLIWAVVWAPVAVLVGILIIDPTDSMDEMWWMVGAIPGFLSDETLSGEASLRDVQSLHTKRLQQLRPRPSLAALSAGLPACEVMVRLQFSPSLE